VDLISKRHGPPPTSPPLPSPRAVDFSLPS
jgi:hypothetical protein